MQNNFDIKNATSTEIKAIEEYTSGTQRKRHTKIKTVVAKEYKNLTVDESYFIPFAKTIESMFQKYDSSFPKDEKLFRGVPLTDELFDIYSKISLGTEIILDKSFMSFSKDLEVALDYAEVDLNDNKSLLIIANNRISNDLDLIGHSYFAEESEILLNKNLKWKVVKSTIEDNSIYLEVEEFL